MIALSLAAALAAQGAIAPGPGTAPPGGWLRFRTPVGELVTDADPALAGRAAARLQRFAQVLRVAAPVPPADTRDAVILAFAGRGAFDALRPRASGRAYEVDGFVLSGTVRSLAAVDLAAGRDDPLETLDHEYVHLALGAALPAQPPWVAEGLAEVLGSWREDEAGVRMGGRRTEHVGTLLNRPLIPLERLLQAGYTSPEFTGEESRPVFYAESWALVRLLLGPDPAAGRQGLLDLLGDLARGTPAPHAFANAFGDPGETQGRLVASAIVPQAVTPMRLPPAPPAVGPEPAPPGLVQSLIGELLLAEGREAEARTRLEDALRADPRLASAHEALAHLALKRGRWPEARQHLDAALQLRPDDPPALHRMAELLVREAGARGEVLSGESEETAVRLLERAVALSPDHADAVDLLAHLRPEPRALRIRMVEHALERHPAHPELPFTLAGLCLGGQDPRGAAAALVRARDTARDETHRFLAEHLLRRLGDFTSGTLEASGRLVALECLPGGVLDFLVEAAPGSITGGVELVMRGLPARKPSPPRQLRLRAATPSSVMLQDASGDLLQRELVCGPQNGTVRVRFRPGTDSQAPAVDGMLITLRFLAG